MSLLNTRRRGRAARAAGWVSSVGAVGWERSGRAALVVDLAVWSVGRSVGGLVGWSDVRSGSGAVGWRGLGQVGSMLAAGGPAASWQAS